MAAVPASHPRQLAINARFNAVVRDAAPIPDNDDHIPLPALGQMQLFSYYRPPLKAGAWTIQVSQNVTLPGDTNPQHLAVSDESQATIATQPFVVLAPQFKIDAKDVHSTYPPQGHSDEPRILPHIVFNDPHLPWERPVKETDTDVEDDAPWMAVFPFDCNGPDRELQLPPELLKKDIIFSLKDVSGVSIDLTQNSNFTISMTVGDFLDLPKTNSARPAGLKIHIPNYAGSDDFSTMLSMEQTDQVEVVFLSGVLFKALFRGQTGPPNMDDFRLLAHARNINTKGMASAGVEDSGLYSVVYSKRTGPTDIAPNTASRSQVVHVLSLEFIAEMTETIDDKDYVALISLYSWTYLCQPPLSVNFVDSMLDIGQQVKTSSTGTSTTESCRLRYPEAQLSTLDTMIAKAASSVNGDKAAQRKLDLQRATAQRLKDGYTIVQHRVATGEQTMAFMRGPLVPVTVPTPRDDWPFASTAGQDYDIFDATLGIMDISYTSAWELGKLQACSDMGFVAALMRIRSDAHKSGLITSTQSAASDVKGAAPAASLARMSVSMNSLASALDATSTPDASLAARFSTAAVTRAAAPVTATAGASADQHTAFALGVANKVQSLGSIAGSDGIPYDEINGPPASTDWGYVQNWILNKLFLDNIPTQYLIGDASFLPDECIRFFHIDNNWFDAYIDGALSVANHMAKEDDAVRASIKDQLNAYFSSTVTDSKGRQHHPQVPVYGFFLRSPVVKVFQDLIIDIPFPKDAESNVKAPILVQKHITPDTLLVLLDRIPEDGLTKWIKFAQPPHQQRFSLGDQLNTQFLEFSWRKIYLNSQSDGTLPVDFLQRLTWTPPARAPDTAEAGRTDKFMRTAAMPMYSWASTDRCLNLDMLETFLFGNNGRFSSDASMSKEWKALTSAFLALQLNDPCYFLELKPGTKTTGSPDATFASRVYSIRTPATRHLKPSNQPSSPITVPSMTPWSPSALRGVTIGSTDLTNAISTLKPPPISIDKIPASLRKVQNSAPTKIVGATIGGPFFQCSIYSSTCTDRKLSKNGMINPIVFVDAPYSQDLIFAVQLHLFADAKGNIITPSLKLKEIQFRLPVNKMAPITALGLVPEGASCGYRARMLSNQRWVVHLDPQPGCMLVRLIPRSMQGMYDLVINRDLSFKLDEVDVTGLWLQDSTPTPGQGNAAFGQAQVIITEIYQTGMAQQTLIVKRAAGWADANKSVPGQVWNY